MEKKKDVWDIVQALSGPLIGLFAAIAVALFGFFGTKYMEIWKEQETKSRLLADIMSRREAAENELRKDMFKPIIESFLKADPDDFEDQVTSLEVLTYNFHESIDLSPLYKRLHTRISQCRDAVRREQCLGRLREAAEVIKYKQIITLEPQGRKHDFTIENVNLQTKTGSLVTEEELNGVKRSFEIFIDGFNPETKELKVRLYVTTVDEGGEPVAGSTVESKFPLGLFAFPSIDNTRLTHDQRVAIVLKTIEPPAAVLTLIYFPGSYSSWKDKPFYDDLLAKLLQSTRTERGNRLNGTEKPPS